MFEMDLFPGGATVALWILPILFTMYTWRRRAEALERPFVTTSSPPPSTWESASFPGRKASSPMGLYWLISLAILGAALFLRHTPRTEIAMDSNTDTGPRPASNGRPGTCLFRNRG